MAERRASPDFRCAICRRMVDMRWNRERSGDSLPPICVMCEGDYSKGVGQPHKGTFRDRWNLRQGCALAEALRCEAARKNWPAHWEARDVAS